jgi:nitrite reductase/ring-hydroxylating ferredoxin subunit
VNALPEDQVPCGRATRVCADGLCLAVGQTAGGPFAVLDICPHLDLPFTAFGPVTLRQDRLVCPWHYWEFELPSGRCVYAPVYRDDELLFFQLEGKDAPTGECAGTLRRFPARLRGGWLQVRLGGEGPGSDRDDRKREALTEPVGLPRE